MALTETQFEEAVVSIIEACHENEEFKNTMVASINADVESLQLTDEELEKVAGGGWGWIAKKVAPKVISYGWNWYRNR